MSDYRECTCHPDDFPPEPCEKQYALTDCLNKRITEQDAVIKALAEWKRLLLSKSTEDIIDELREHVRWMPLPPPQEQEQNDE